MCSLECTHTACTVCMRSIFLKPQFVSWEDMQTALCAEKVSYVCFFPSSPISATPLQLRVSDVLLLSLALLKGKGTHSLSLTHAVWVTPAPPSSSQHARYSISPGGEGRGRVWRLTLTRKRARNM